MILHSLRSSIILLTMFCICVAGSPVNAEMSDAAKAKKLYFTAEKQLADKEYDTALESLAKVEKLMGGGNARVSYLRIKTYMEMEQYASAEVEVKRFFEYKSSDALSREVMSFSTLIDEKRHEEIEKEKLRIAKIELEKNKLLEARKKEYAREKRDLDMFTAFGTNQEIKDKAEEIYFRALDAIYDKRYNEAIELSREIDTLIGDTTKQAKRWTTSIRVVSFFHLSEWELAKAELDDFYSDGRPARFLKKKMNAYRDEIDLKLPDALNSAQTQTYNNNDNGVVEPVVILRVAPNYPAKAARLGVSALVMVKFTVDSTGSTKSCTASSDANPRLNFERAACDAVLQWQYEPASLDGTPVDYNVELGLDFKLN